jgi:hypothetical protein
MNAAADEFTSLLRTQGVIPTNAPAPPGESTDRPWFVSLLQGVAGWLAGIFLLIFVGLVFKPESGPVIFGLGVFLLAAAWFLYFADRHGAFLDQLALAISIAGQIAVAGSILKDHFSGLNVSVAALVVQIFVLLVMPNKLARTLAALFAIIAWIYTVRFLVQPGNAEEVFFGERSASDSGVLHAGNLPIAWLITWLPLLALAAGLVLREPHWMAGGLRRLARPLLTGLLLGLSLGTLAAEPFTVVIWGADIWGRGIDWLAIFPLLSIGLALVAAYLAFRLRNHGLLGFAVFAALLHLARFYYLFGTTLMWKSVIMLVVGAALLLAGFALRNLKPEVEVAP